MKNRNSFFFFLLWLGCMCFVSGNLVAQISYPGAMPTVQTPEVASLVRSVMNPVDLYTGQVNIQIPLYNVTCKNIQVPILLNYKTSGVKVHDLPTWVGLGWDLVCGGKITRIVRGKPDERGFCAGDGGELARNYYSWLTSELEDIVEKGQIDFEPDLFFFQVPGNSGVFVVNQNCYVYTVPHSNLKIDWVGSNFFIMLDEKGWKYTFGQSVKENTTITSYDKDHEDGKIETYVSVWYLEKIEDIEGNTVTFSYVTGGNLNYLDYNLGSKLTVNPMAQGNKIEKETIPYGQTSVSIVPKYLSQITAGSVVVKFNSSAGNTGLYNLKKLENIEVYVFDQLVETINLSYSNFNNGYLKLEGVKNVAGDNNLLIARFSYNASQNLPDRASKDFDHWGYYNGALNTGYRPTFTYNAVAECPGASRAPSFFHAKADILTKVWNNLGGCTEYFYGENQVCNNGFVNEVVGGVRIDSIKQSFGYDDMKPLVTKYEYVQENGTCSGTKYAEILLYVPPRVNSDPRVKVEVFCPAMRINNVFDLNGSPVAYSRVKEIYPNGSFSVYEYSSHEDLGYSDIPVDHYLSPQALSEGWQYLSTPTSMFWKRGLLKCKKNYDKENRLTGRLTNTYSVDASRKNTIPGYCPLTIIHPGGGIQYARFQYQWEIYPVLLMSTETSGNTCVSAKTEYVYNMEYLLPREVKEQNLVTLETRKVKIKYPFDLNPDHETDKNVSDGIWQMQLQHMLNYPIEQVVEVGGKVVEGQIYKYEYVGRYLENKVKLKRIDHLVTGSPLTDYNSYLNTSLTPVDSRYKKITSIQYDGDNIICVKKDDNNPNSAIYQTGIYTPIADIVNGIPLTEQFVDVHVNIPPNVNYYQNSLFSWYFYTPERSAAFGVIKVYFQGSIDMNREFIIRYPERGLMVTKVVSVAFLYQNYEGISFFSRIPTDKIEIGVKETGTDIMFRVELDFYNRYYYMSGNSLHTSFEDTGNATVLPKAKSGVKAWKNNHVIKLNKFQAGDYVLTYWKSTEGEIWEKIIEEITITSSTPDKIIGSTTYYIDELRLLPRDARVNTRTFLPGGEINSETDHNGNTIYYEYDVFGRLTRVLDNDRIEIKRYEYFIKN